MSMLGRAAWAVSLAVCAFAAPRIAGAQSCRDPWITQAYREVAGRPPQGSGDAGECDWRQYNGGSWGSYPELAGYVRARLAVQRPAQPEPPPPTLGQLMSYVGGSRCADGRIDRAFQEVAGRPPQGNGREGECDPARYNRGSWGNDQELAGWVRYTLGGSGYAQGFCATAGLAEVIRKVRGTPPDGAGNGGECDAGRYHGGRGFRNAEELEALVRVALGSGQGRQAVAVPKRCGADGNRPPFDDRYFAQVDYGLYWFGPFNACEKAGEWANPSYFRDDRPTVIYVHGLQTDSTVQMFRESFYDPQRGVDMAADWLKAGWNVGVFYWNQFSDEPEPMSAEAKIWNAQAMSAKTRGILVNIDGRPLLDQYGRQQPAAVRVTTGDWAGKSAADLLFEAYVAALKGYRGKKIHLVGHSLGSQMVLRLAAMAAQRAPALMPRRVTLLDSAAFFHTDANSQDLGAVLNAVVKNDAGQDVHPAVEFVQSSWAPEALASLPRDGQDWIKRNSFYNELWTRTAFVHLFPDLPASDLRGQHVYAIDWYFRSLGRPPFVCDTLEPAVSAGASDDVVRRYMGGDEYFKEVPVTRADRVCLDAFVRSKGKTRRELAQEQKPWTVPLPPVDPGRELIKDIFPRPQGGRSWR